VKADATVMSPVLDTHVWLWWMGRDPRLGESALEALDSLPGERRPYLCDISLWEVAMLVGQGRISVDGPLSAWLETAAHPRAVRVIPIVPAIAAEVANPPQAFRGDSADRLIVATCRVLDVPLLSHDSRIVQSRLVKRWTLS
jgi:PIN domain nuclease of toxin-antitoxin system